jgi:hypothetical protein
MKKDLSNSEFSYYTVVYNFKHSRMGFQNSVTVIALNAAQATELAKNEVSGAYGSKMLPRFTFAPPVFKH